MGCGVNEPEPPSVPDLSLGRFDAEVSGAVQRMFSGGALLDSSSVAGFFTIDLGADHQPDRITFMTGLLAPEKFRYPVGSHPLHVLSAVMGFYDPTDDLENDAFISIFGELRIYERSDTAVLARFDFVGSSPDHCGRACETRVRGAFHARIE